MIMVFVISTAIFFAGEIKAYMRNRETMELKLMVKILEQQAEIGELKNRIMELELGLE